MDLITKCLAVAVVLTLSFRLTDASDAVLTLSYSNSQITFGRKSFESFYKCLCNAVMTHCNVSYSLGAAGLQFKTSTFTRSSYLGGEVLESPKRECHIDLTNGHVIRCSGTTKTTKRLQFYPDFQDTNNRCNSDHVKVAWAEDIEIQNFDPKLINITNYTD